MSSSNAFRTLALSLFLVLALWLAWPSGPGPAIAHRSGYCGHDGNVDKDHFIKSFNGRIWHSSRHRFDKRRHHYHVVQHGSRINGHFSIRRCDGSDNGRRVERGL